MPTDKLGPDSLKAGGGVGPRAVHETAQTRTVLHVASGHIQWVLKMCGNRHVQVAHESHHHDLLIFGCGLTGKQSMH